MSKSFHIFNGRSPYVDYEKLEESYRRRFKWCSDAEVFIFNNFPVPVSTESNIDFILMIAVMDRPGNYYKIRTSPSHTYFHNLILPVKVISDYLNEPITLDNGILSTKEGELSYYEELNSIRLGLRNYLGNKCHFEKDRLYIKPLVFIQNNNQLAVEGHLVGQKFDFDTLISYLERCNDNIFMSYQPWRSEIGFASISHDVKRIISQASIDSATGYITKKKIDRISKELSVSSEAYNEVGKRLIIIEGKAGTGKTSEMLHLIMRCIADGQKTIFITFNKLLVYDISKTLHSYIAQVKGAEENQKQEVGQPVVINLHRYIYQLSKSIGLLHLMSEQRILEVSDLLEKRTAVILQFVKSFLTSKHLSSIDYRVVNSLKTDLQNSKLHIAIIEVGIDFANYLNKEPNTNASELAKKAESFISLKKKLLSKLEGDKIFIADYYKVLEDTLLAVRNPDLYFNKYDISTKHSLLAELLNLPSKNDKLPDAKIDREAFFKTLKARFVRRRQNRILFVDEAQDFHRYEREIFMSIFHPNNIVISSGGYEQLIRHVELCKWNFFYGKKLLGQPRRQVSKVTSKIGETSQFNIFSPDDLVVGTIDVKEEDLSTNEVVWYKKGRRSYRVKKTILSFCNYLAEKCNIPLGLQAIESEDEGELIFDFRSAANSATAKEEMDSLKRHADMCGCTPYEGLLMLLPSDAKDYKANHTTPNNKSAVINEYGNIEDSSYRQKKKWQHSEAISKDILIWDGAVDDKNEIGLPSASESRLIYYESCRGLEALTVACFNLDKFFSSKIDHPDGEKYLIEEEREKAMPSMSISNDERKRMFAGTWVLMALTRAMDKVYISIDNPESEFGTIVQNYLATNPKNIKVKR